MPILCPSTYNFVNPKYLYSLKDSDIAEVRNLDLGTLCLNHLWNEVDAWKAKVFKDGSDFNGMLWIGGCLPLLAVVYMDFLDFGVNAEQINYSIPRMSHIRNENFIFWDVM
ncbi:uncharacterized protein LOC124671847 [Lolium rigidum]|uniref:uncharacterized protein LOC124671847 n=1 Tax=Lolium rigidum TaxID=89674 RepID=UPI001F5D5100|nr:uncharacterized protein LOC124671847 [Lolium rigidum]